MACQVLTRRLFQSFWAAFLKDLIPDHLFSSNQICRFFDWDEDCVNAPADTKSVQKLQYRSNVLPRSSHGDNSCSYILYVLESVELCCWKTPEGTIAAVQPWNEEGNSISCRLSEESKFFFQEISKSELASVDFDHWTDVGCPVQKVPDWIRNSNPHVTNVQYHLSEIFALCIVST